MTIQDPAIERWSLRGFLLDGPGGPILEQRSDAASASSGELGRTLTRLEVVRAERMIERLSQEGRRVTDEAVGRAIEELCDLDLGVLILTAWAKHRALLDAGRGTLDRPGTEEIVELGAHTLSSVHQPYVDLLVDGIRVARIPVEIVVELTVHAALLVVRAGRLVELRTGRGQLEGRISAAGALLVRRRDEVDLPGRLRLRRPWPLAHAAQHGRPA